MTSKMENKRRKVQGAPPQKIFIIEDCERRQNKDGQPFGIAHALASSTNFSEVHCLIIQDSLMEKIKNENFYLITIYQFLDDGTIRLTKETKLLETGRPMINQEVIRRWRDPLAIRVSEVETKNKGDRVSVKGTIIKVTSILETEKSKRRLIELEDDKLIQIKLWGQKSNLNPLEGETVLFKCLVVDIYRNTFSLNSTSLTSYQVVQDDEAIQGVVEAASFEDEGNTIFIQELMLRVPADVMDTIFPLGSFVEGTNIEGKRAGSTLKSVRNKKFSEGMRNFFNYLDFCCQDKQEVFRRHEQLIQLKPGSF